jgi:hypothetical protein
LIDGLADRAAPVWLRIRPAYCAVWLACLQHARVTGVLALKVALNLDNFKPTELGDLGGTDLTAYQPGRAVSLLFSGGINMQPSL